MGFLFYFRLSSYLLIGSGFLALLVTDDYGILSAIIFGTIIITGWRVDSGKLRFPVSPLIWNLVTIVFLGFCIADILFIRRVVSVGLVNFLVFLQMTRIVTPKRDRDYVTIYIISFFELLISSIMTLSILFALSCILFAVTGVWALITLHLKQEIETHILRNNENHKSSPPADEAYFNIPALSSLLNAQFFAGTFGITLITFLLSLIVFFIMPRVQQGFFFSRGISLSQPVAGFSEEVALDTFGMIRLDHRPVMRVLLPAISDENSLSQRFYWKGLSYNRYDGMRWRSDTHHKRVIPARSYYRQRVWLIKPKTTKNLLEQRFELLSSDYRVLFAAHQVYGAQGRFLSMQYDRLSGNADVTINQYSPNYTVYSETTPPPEETLRNDHRYYSDNIRKFYLQLPELAKRVKELAYKVGGGFDNTYDTAVAIQNYLFQNYEYSLDINRSSGLMPLEDFLFVNKAGHCEYYATSMAILLRILGIPTRVVNGFAQGRWNEFGSFFTVRQSDAHAWVEVYFPSHGWVSFDPTPSVAFSDIYQQYVEQRSFLASLYRYSEYIKTKWDRYIIDYSSGDQAQLVVGAFRATHSARYNLRYYIRSIKRHIQNLIARISLRHIGFFAGSLVAIFFIARLFSRMFSHFHISLPTLKKRPHSTGKQLIRFYKTMLHILARKGITKHEAATPGEFARYVAQKHPSYSTDVRFITDFYYTVRYGRSSLCDEDLLRIETMLKNMKKTQPA